MLARMSSAVGTGRVPSFAFRRCNIRPLSSFAGGLASEEGGRRRMGAKKAERAPEGVLASMIVICELVADENHLKPLMDYGPGVGRRYLVCWLPQQRPAQISPASPCSGRRSRLHALSSTVRSSRLFWVP